MSDKKWLTIIDAAEYLCCSERFLRNEIAKKNIPFTYYGGKALFNSDQLDQFLIGLQSTSQEDQTDEIDYIYVKEIGENNNQSHDEEIAIEKYKDSIEKIWGGNTDCEIVEGTVGSSAKFKGIPCIWIFSDYLKVAPEGKGNKYYKIISEIRKKQFKVRNNKSKIFYETADVKWSDISNFIHNVYKVVKNV